MDVILHAGAHRTGTTSFQTYLRTHDDWLTAHGAGFWGPWRTRKGLFDGLLDHPETPAEHRRADRSTGRLRMNLAMAKRHGARSLVISDENMLGSIRRNVADCRLYPDAGERMARLHAALGGVTRVTLQIRGLDLWWASALAYLLPRGGIVPDTARCERMAFGARSWRDVITDVACACPGADIVVTPFERFAGQPDALLSVLLGRGGLPATGPATYWANRSPRLPALRAALALRDEEPGGLPCGAGRWMPFDEDQAAALRDTYADDLLWLRAGADGLARLTEEDGSPTRGQNPARSSDKRGRKRHDRPARILAPDG